MIDIATEQRTPAWFRVRLGHITGSRCGDLMKSGRKKEEIFSETAKSYIYQLAAERMMNPAVVNDDELFGQYLDTVQVTSKAMRFGTEQEDNAKALFEKMSGLHVQEVSSCTHDTIPNFAASPDGVIFEDMRPIACVEVKCPEQKTYLKYVTDIHDAESLKAVKPEYYWQVQAEMECTGTALCYFIAYCPWQTNPIHVVPIARVIADAKLLTERVQLANETIEHIINDGRKQQQSLQTLFHSMQQGTSDCSVAVA